MLTGEQAQFDGVGHRAETILRPNEASMSACDAAGGGLDPQEEVRKKKKGSREAPLF